MLTQLNPLFRLTVSRSALRSLRMLSVRPITTQSKTEPVSNPVPKFEHTLNNIPKESIPHIPVKPQEYKSVSVLGSMAMGAGIMLAGAGWGSLFMICCQTLAWYDNPIPIILWLACSGAYMGYREK